MGSETRRRPERIFRLLMRLLPAEFREDFGDEMRSAFRADHDDAQRGGRRGGPLRFWWRTATGILRTAPREHLDTLRGDIRYGLRTMRRRPLFTLTAVLSLAIGIGATTTVVAVFNAIFVRSIPGVERSEHLINVKPKKTHEETFLLTSYPNFVDLRDGSQALSDLAGFHGFALSLGVEANAEPEVMSAQLVTWNYFGVLGLQPQLGRFFDPEEDEGDGAHPIAVISSWLWANRFGRDPSILGRPVRPQVLFRHPRVLQPGHHRILSLRGHLTALVAGESLQHADEVLPAPAAELVAGGGRDVAGDHPPAIRHPQHPTAGKIRSMTEITPGDLDQVLAVGHAIRA